MFGKNIFWTNSRNVKILLSHTGYKYGFCSQLGSINYEGINSESKFSETIFQSAETPQPHWYLLQNSSWLRLHTQQAEHYLGLESKYDVQNHKQTKKHNVRPTIDL